MNPVFRCFLYLSLMFSGIAFPWSAQAAYTFTIVRFPGADGTQLWGVNNSGQILGQALYNTAPTVNFLYDAHSKAFTTLPSVPGVITGMLGINDQGVIVGSTIDSNEIETAFTRTAKGAFAMFSHPAPSENTEARGVGNSGLVTGFAYDDNGDNNVGFIYDPSHGTYIDLPFVNSSQILPQGMNISGQVVGSVALPDSGPYSGYPPGIYGFLRDTNGAITLHQVGGTCTRNRGINNVGQITGWTRACGPDHHASGFVANLTGSSSQTLTVPNATDTIPQAINDAGQVVGATESDGFIATPVAANKDQCKSGWPSLSRADGSFFKNQGDCIQYVDTGK